MKARYHRQAVLLAAILLSGCFTPPPGGVRARTYAVTGIVHVDGKPMKDVLISFHPQEGGKVKIASSATTDENGKFSAMTYVKGDGLPQGTYKLTFVKDETPPNQDPRANAEFKDGLNGLYADRTTSTHDLTVKSGKNDMGVIELSSK